MGFTIEYPFLFAGSFGYLFIVWALPKLVAGTKIAESPVLKMVMMTYNVVQVVVCGYMTVGLWKEMKIVEEEIKIGLLFLDLDLLLNLDLLIEEEIEKEEEFKEDDEEI